MIKRPEYGKKMQQITQAGGILTWEDGTPSIMLMISDFVWTFRMQKSKHAPGPKTPGWYAYWQPKREEDEDEECS